MFLFILFINFWLAGCRLWQSSRSKLVRLPWIWESCYIIYYEKKIHSSAIFLLPVLLSSRGLSKSPEPLPFKSCPSMISESLSKPGHSFLAHHWALHNTEIFRAELMSLPDNVGQQPKSWTQNTECNKNKTAVMGSNHIISPRCSSPVSGLLWDGGERMGWELTADEIGFHYGAISRLTKLSVAGPYGSSGSFCGLWLCTSMV